MSEMRKITVEVPAEDLSAAQSFTGSGVTETVREGLKRLAVIRAQQEMRTLRGTFKFSLDINTLREDRAFEKKRK
jgi:hypothetical protein